MKAVRVMLVGLVASVVAFACERSPTAARTAPLSARSVATSSTKTSGLVVCSQAYDSVSQVIGPMGGIITVGPHIFLVDTLALSAPVTITAVAPADTVRWVRFQPNGLVFQTGKNGWPAIIYTTYKDCAVATTTTPRIAQVSDSLSILGYLQTYVQSKKNPWSQANAYAAGLLWHFSNYAVAW
jgi:hypothetical protein